MEKLVNLLMKNEHDYFVLPHSGLVPDWYERYWELHKEIAEYAGYNDYYIPENIEPSKD